MSIRLCQECCQWVWAKAGRCPDCQDYLSETINPEEFTSRFRALVGTVHGRIGYVRIPRKNLPEDGILYETENGLFFLPHQTVTRTRLVEANSSSPLWTVAAALWAPMIIVLPFLKRRQLKEQPFEETEPIRLSADNLHVLPELLGRHPGSLFIPLKSVRSVRSKRKDWLIERTSGSPVRIQPSEALPFALKMRRLLEGDSWNSLADSL